MTIGAHISGLDPHHSRLLSSLKIISSKSPDHTFLYFTESAVTELGENGINIIITPRSKNKLLLYYWYNYKLPALLKKYNITVFVSNAGMLNMKTEIKQYLFFDTPDSDKTNSRFFIKIFKASLAKAENIFTTEDYLTKVLIEKYGITRNKLSIVYHGLSDKSYLHKANGELIKEKYTQGHDYFLSTAYTSASDQLIVLLKGFSQLKKWQKTSMKLVVLLHNISEKDAVPDFKNYKYKEDVILLQRTVNIENELLPNCFALIWSGSFEQRDIVFAGMQHEIPIIVSDNKINKSLFSEAVLYTTLTAADLAAKMQVLYKDEEIRNKKIEQGKILLEKYDLHTAASALQQIILP